MITNRWSKVDWKGVAQVKVKPYKIDLLPMEASDKTAPLLRFTEGNILH
jgi:hypothetical protein